ncbi:hypothetical protein NCC78_16195 [Micromonospora phytophila]|uniref:hypothetical protein n=1 Tax=Micromonospora phytophila TaxID=709888 RepID=UPI00202FD84B|nr:hypothetical protein [Micromonospora phytophila]MCM0676219.1 hypothetical protein [Micromonospora phytophila]
MDVEAVRVEGYHEVLALHRMLMECKSEDLGTVYAGSPFIAAIQHRLADALEAADPGRGWHDWRSADAHPHTVEAVRAHLTEACSWWQEANEDQRLAYVRDLLAPLRPSQELLAELATTATTRPPGD